MQIKKKTDSIYGKLYEKNIRIEERLSTIFFKKFILAFMMILLFTLLAGCGEFTLNNESSWQIRQYENAGREIMEEYLSENFPDAKITACSCRKVYEGGYSYITDYVDGRFCIGEEYYYYVVNVNSGDVYTTYYEDEIGERVCEQIVEKLGIENYKISSSFVAKVVRTTTDESLDSFSLDETMNVYIPGNITEDNLNAFIAEVLSGNGYYFDFTVCYNDDIRIEDMDINQLSEQFQNVRLQLVHRQADSDVNQASVLDREEELYIIVNEKYRYTSYNRVEKDNVFLVYEEYSCDGDGYVDISKTNLIKADNFCVSIDEEKIDIDLKEDVEYYLCFYNMDFLNGNDLYYYLTTTEQYKKAEIVEDAEYYYSLEYYGGTRPIYQSETFYIGNPAAED